MSFTSVLAPEFSIATRARGVGYVATGRVSIVSRSADTFDTAVRGTEPYLVHLSATPDGRTTALLGSCTCPHATDQVTPCKHLWATLLVAERDGWPLLDRAPTRESLTFQLVDSPETDEETAEAEWDRRAGRPRPPGIRPGYGLTQAPRQGRPPSAGTAFLNHLDNQLLAREHYPAVLSLGTGELLYVIDAAASRLHTGVVLQLMRRQRKRTGDWGRPKPARPEAVSLADAPADESIRARGAGWRERRIDTNELVRRPPAVGPVIDVSAH